MEYINRLLRKGGSKKSDPVGPHQLPGEKREFAEENDFSQCQQSTPVKHLDCDTESDTTAEYESAGEASPWEKPSNISALADYLAGVHLSTPDKIHTELTYFPFSPISAEDECDDEVTAIISNGSQSSSHTLSFHEREEISVSKQDKTVSDVANTSFSDVDPEEFKNSAPCKRHSETNLSSFFHSETLQLSDEAFGKNEGSFENEMSCSIEENKLKTPPPSLNESEEITSSVVATVEKLCDSVNNKVISETKSPKRYTTLNLSSSDNINEDPVLSFVDNERKLVVQSSSDTSFSTSNKSPLPVSLEKDVPSLDSLEESNVNVISEIESSLNDVQGSDMNNYVTTTKYKIDTLFSSNKEIISNVICETKQQIDNMFKPKSPIKELASNTILHVIDSIKNLNTSEPDLSPQKNLLKEKISSPISSAKQKIDSLFSPKKAVVDEEIVEKTVSGISVVNKLCGNELLKKDCNETNLNYSSSNTVIVEHLNHDTSVSGLSVIPLTKASESNEVIKTTKQQIDKIFKSLSPTKVPIQSEVLELSNSTMSTDLEQEDEVCIVSRSTHESGYEPAISQQSSGIEFSINEPPKNSSNITVNAEHKTENGEVVSSSEGNLESSSILLDDNKSLNETCTISEVTLPVDLKPEVKDNTISEVLNNTTTDDIFDRSLQENIKVVQGGDEKSHSTHESGYEPAISQQSSGIEFSINEPPKNPSNITVNAEHKTEIGEVISSSEGNLGSSFILLDENKSVNETCTISEVTLPVDSMPEVKDNAISEVLNKTTTDDFCEKSIQENITVVQGGDEKTGHVDDLAQAMQDSVSPNNNKINEKHMSDYQSMFEVFDKDMLEASRSFDVMSPKKESFNVSLSAILDQKEVFSENITEPLTKILANDSIIKNEIHLENHNEKTSSTHTINPRPEMSPNAPNLDQSNVNIEHEKSVVPDSESDINISVTQKSPERSDPTESVGSFDVKDLKEIDNMPEMHRTEEVIDNHMVCMDSNDSQDRDSELKPLQDKVDIFAVDQMALRKEVDDFVVVDVAELDKDSVHVSSYSPSSDFQEKEVLDSPNVSSKFNREEKVDEENGSIQHTASELCSLEIKPASPLKELMKDNVEVFDAKVTVSNVKEKINADDVEPVSIIPECGSGSHEIHIEENVKCSTLMVSSIKVKNEISNNASNEGESYLQSQEVMPQHVELENKVESRKNISENNFTTELVVEKEKIGVCVPAEEKCADVKVTEVGEHFPVLNEKSNFNKAIDDSVFIQNDTEQRRSDPVNSQTSAECLGNITSDKRTIDFEIETLQNEEHICMKLNTINKSPCKEESVEKNHDFKPRQINEKSKQDQTYGEESMGHLDAGLDEMICISSEIIVPKTLMQCLSEIPSKYKGIVEQASSDVYDTSVKSISKDNENINASVVGCNNEVYKPTERRRSPPGEAANNLFNEIFQHGKDQMCRTTSIVTETKQSKSEVSVAQNGAKKIEQSYNPATNEKSSGIPTHDNSEFINNDEFSSEHVQSNKVKSPPFACPVSSDSIAFGSPSEYSLSLSPIDTELNNFPSGIKSVSPKSSVENISASNSTSTVSVNKTFSSSAEIGMGLKSSSESLEIVKNDISKQNNELSSSSQATLHMQGEMSTRNEKYSYTYNKNSKDFRSSPVNKNSENEFSSLSDNFKTFKLDDLSKSTIERKSYEDLLDRCLEQERLLGFDETIKEEADKLIKEIANASSDDICVQPDEFPPANANNSEAGPVTADEDLNKAELFQDATLFDFDYLSKIGKGKPSRRLVRESLFLKFDPLAAAAAAVATPEPAQEMAQADSSSDVINTPPRAPPLLNGDDKLVSITPNDEAACSPASSTVATPPRSKPRTSSCSATPTLRHEILSKEISKLQDLMMRQESSYQEQIAACTEEVEILREKLAELEARDNQADLQGKLAATEAEAVKLRKELAEATDSKKQLMMIMEEYEKTISQVVTMREDDKKKFEMEKEQISMEREGALLHLRNMEIAFNDVHQKYEKCKEVIEAFKHNEEQYKISLNENRKTIIQQEENYRKLKEHAAQKLEQANIEISEMKKAHQAEIAKMVAVQRKMEIRVKSLEESLEQKKREAAELTKICDDLITKVEQ